MTRKQGRGGGGGCDCRKKKVQPSRPTTFSRKRKPRTNREERTTKKGKNLVAKENPAGGGQLSLFLPGIFRYWEVGGKEKIRQSIKKKEGWELKPTSRGKGKKKHLYYQH